MNSKHFHIDFRKLAVGLFLFSQIGAIDIAQSALIKLYDPSRPVDEAKNRYYQPIVTAIGLDQINGLTLDFSQLWNVHGDIDHLKKMRTYVLAHPKPDAAAGSELAEWYKGLAKVTPVVTFSLHARTKEGIDTFSRSGWGSYFVGEAILPLGLLMDIHRHLYAEPPVAAIDSTILEMAAPQPRSIKLNAFALDVFNVIPGAPIHILTADLRAQIYLKTLLASDEAFQDARAPGLTPDLMRRSAAKALSRDYWTISNSVRMQTALLNTLVFSPDWGLRTLFLQAAIEAGGIGLGAHQTELNRYLNWIIQELEELKGTKLDREKTEFVKRARDLFLQLQKTSWSTPDLDWDGLQSRLRFLAAGTRARPVQQIESHPLLRCESAFTPSSTVQ